MTLELDPEAGVYAISVAAQLTGVTPQTLRLYEARGLVEPARTEGGTRRYSHRDLERVTEILSMTAEGLTLEGVKRLLELQAETDALRAEVRRLQEQLDSERPRHKR